MGENPLLYPSSHYNHLLTQTVCAVSYNYMIIQSNSPSTVVVFLIFTCCVQCVFAYEAYLRVPALDVSNSVKGSARRGVVSFQIRELSPPVSV